MSTACPDHPVEYRSAPLATFTVPEISSRIGSRGKKRAIDDTGRVFHKPWKGFS